VVGNNAHPDAGVPVKITGLSGVGPVATIPNGLQDVSILLSGADNSQQLQIFTRDGRHVGGTPLDSLAVAALMTVDNGFDDKATYSGSYLNGKYNPSASPISNQSNYKDLQVFYGVKAEVGRELQWDMSEADPTQHIPLSSTPLPATLTGYRIPAGQNELLGGLFKLNGQTLTGSATSNNGAPLQASDLATWINGQNIALSQGISAKAENSIVVRSGQIDFRKTLELGSKEPDDYNRTVYITAGNATELVTGINAQSELTGVTATLSDNGDLILSNDLGNDIDILNDDNSLGLNAETYTGRLSISRSLETGVDTPIELTFAGGKPSDLAKLGFSTGVYIKSLPGNDKTQASKPFGEDLLVFVTGAGNAAVSATFTGTPISAKQSLRQEQLVLKFDTPSHFTITDKLTGTVVASRDFDPTKLDPGVKYLGLEMSFSNPPAAGDIFEINGNQDGTANNENMLQIAALENAPVASSGKSIGAAYIDQVNDMGNIARQASIAKSALTVVYDQAVVTRDQVSGVSLDNEAADLIRYQQAYQAAAKILQISSQLFDSVLQVR
jgi:flagellar hook-associated protein FlgK